MSLLAASLSPELLAEFRSLVRAEVRAALVEERERDDGRVWLTAAEAGAYLGISDKAVRQRIRRGRIPAAAVRHQGRRVLINRRKLDRHIEEGL